MPHLARILFLFFVLIAASASAETVRLSLITETGRYDVTAEIADTPATRAKGLMYRDNFGGDDAMVFVFPVGEQRAFWMKNTPVSLDIIFFAEDGTWLNTYAHTVPFSTKSLPSKGLAKYALELPAGRASELGLGKGAVLKLQE